jgi:hypothetical protein
VNLSNGSLIWIAESDDYCKPEFLAETVSKMQEYPSAGLVFTQSLELDEISGTEYISFQDSPRFKRSFQHAYFNEGRKEVATKLVHENTIPNASGVLFRKSCYEQVGGANESMKLCGDWFLWVKMLLVSDVYFLAEPLNIFRLTHHSVRNKFSKAQTFHERIQILDWMRNNGIKKVPAKERRLMTSLFNNFKIRDLGKPVKMVLSEPLIGNKRLKMISAFAGSVIDRITGKISRMNDKMVSL